MQVVFGIRERACDVCKGGEQSGSDEYYINWSNIKFSRIVRERIIICNLNYYLQPET